MKVWMAQIIPLSKPIINLTGLMTGIERPSKNTTSNMTLNGNDNKRKEHQMEIPTKCPKCNDDHLDITITEMTSFTLENGILFATDKYEGQRTIEVSCYHCKWSMKKTD